MSELPLVFIVVLNYRSAQDTKRCVDSILRTDWPAKSVIVIDNGSGDEGWGRLRYTLPPTASLVALNENLGYAAGNNVGVRMALERGADYVWILNPDTVVAPSALTWLVACFQLYPGAGIVGSRVYHGGSDPRSIWFDGADIDWTQGGATSHRPSGISQGLPTRPFVTDYVTGASMLIRSEVFAQVGLIPEDYFLYFEETDFNLRVQEAGWSTIVEPRSEIDHFKRSSGWLPTPYYVYYFARNRILFQQRWSPVSKSTPPPDLKAWIAAWRERVASRAPSSVATFDELIHMALQDASRGVSGKNPAIETIGNLS